MSSDRPELPVDVEPQPADAGRKAGRLNRALDQSEQVHEKVEQAGADLSSVNAVLKDELSDSETPKNVGRALGESEMVESRVQEAAAELAVVNHALAAEVKERHYLEHELELRDAALAQSRAHEAQAKRVALHDAATGLPNLTLFNDRLRHALAQAQRHAWRLAIMFIDLDDFKHINDTHGHDAGDRVLRTVARRLQTMVRSSDTLSRRSGDEFLFLMLEAGDGASVALFAAKIVENIKQPCDIDGIQLVVNASIGIAIYPDHGHSPEELLKHADTAMYGVKSEHHSTAPPQRSKP